MLEMAKARPPYVTFEKRAQEVRSAEGTMLPSVDIDIALVTPIGSKDRIERIVSEWFPALQAQVMQGRFEQSWLDAFRASYNAWCKDEEPPVNGTSIRNWPVLTPAQIKNLTQLRIVTVEDLAEANEETLRRIGMGGRMLKLSAQEWLKTAGGTGPLVARLAALEQKLGEIATRNEQLEAANAKLKAALPAET